MGEALLLRRGGGEQAAYNGQTEWIYTANGTFTPPVDGEYEITCIGGGGGGGCTTVSQTKWWGGGGGTGALGRIRAMLHKSSEYAVTVGIGGAINTNGGSSSFSDLITATGGTKGLINTYGGDGGKGGDIGIVILKYSEGNISASRTGGVGAVGSGGGGGGTNQNGNAAAASVGGAGGAQNGGGGGGETTRGLGNGYGGNGSFNTTKATNATGPGGGGGGGGIISNAANNPTSAGTGYDGRVTITLIQQVALI